MAKVYACFWFDVEDYITPESDDALRSLIDIFEERGARGTWKLVGEKFRVLQQRGRSDIIEALHHQDVGYHTDNHSQHPTISEYETGLGWRAGVAEFDRRERPGFDELTREFGPVSCYGQPGGAWAPQAFPVLSRWGIPMYLDEGRHIGLDHKPFWFQNVLTAFNLQENCVRADPSAADKPAALERARRRFDAAAQRLKPEGGFISVYYHPCEFATVGFWDGVNFSRGANPPREQWRGAPLLSPAEARARLAQFAGLLDIALGHPDVEVVDAARLLKLYRPAAIGAPIETAALAQVAAGMGGDISYATIGGAVLSPAELLTALLHALSTWADSGALPAAVPTTAPLGPEDRRGSAGAGTAKVADIAAAARDAERVLKETGHIPAAVRVGAAELAPSALFTAAAVALQRLVAGGNGSDDVRFPASRLALEDCVGSDEGEMWGWSIFPQGFSPADLLELTRLQTWTVKPARLR